MTPDAAPSIEERLPPAFTEIAGCLTGDPLPPMWAEQVVTPRANRTRALVAAGVAIALAIGAAVAVNVATSARNSGHPPPASNSTRTAIAPFVDDGPLTSPRSYRGGLIMLSPPPAGTHARATAREAYNARIGPRWAHEPLHPDVLLADATDFDYGNVQRNGTIKPIIDNRLVWVIVYDDVPVGSLRRGGGPARKRGATVPSTVPVDPSTPSGATVLVFVDAKTGRAIFATGFPGSYTTPTTAPTTTTASACTSADLETLGDAPVPTP